MKRKTEPTTTELSDELAELASQVRDLHAAAKEAAETLFNRVIDTGRLLIEAKAKCKHGEWLPFLQAAGVHERYAQRCMQLVEAGIDEKRLASDFGSVRAALDFLADARPLQQVDREPPPAAESIRFSEPVSHPSGGVITIRGKAESTAKPKPSIRITAADAYAEIAAARLRRCLDQFDFFARDLMNTRPDEMRSAASGIDRQRHATVMRALRRWHDEFGDDEGLFFDFFDWLRRHAQKLLPADREALFKSVDENLNSVRRNRRMNVLTGKAVEGWPDDEEFA